MFKTIDKWDETLWDKVRPIYEQAFAGKGAKPEKIICNMFRKGICLLHVVLVDKQVVAMALTGKINEVNTLLIDYLAVGRDFRGKGYGLAMIGYIKEWCHAVSHFDSLMIEVESDVTSENLARVHFWEKCGFVLTDYIHHYIWVQEPYQAMFLKLTADAKVPENGEELFKYIGKFHKASFQGI